MSRKIIGMMSTYWVALEKKKTLSNMQISAALVCEMVEEISVLQNAVIDLKASLRTCQNTSSNAMEQYKDL